MSAPLVGEPTYGDLAHTTLMELDDGSGVLMTTGKYLSGKGQDYSGKGVPVDVQVALAAVKVRSPGSSLNWVQWLLTRIR